MTILTEEQRITEWLGAPEPILATVQTPAASKAVESVSAAARAYYQEQGDYENTVKAIRLYVLARRRTTELLIQERGSNTYVTDMGFTKMQWSRRLKELRVPADALDAYFDDMIAKGWNPSIAGLLKVNEPDGEPGDELVADIATLVRAARRLNESEKLSKLSLRQRRTVADVLNNFGE